MLSLIDHKEVVIEYLDLFTEKLKNEKSIELDYELEFFYARQPEILKTKLATGANLDIYTAHPINDGPDFDDAGYIKDLSDQPLSEKILDTVKPFVVSDTGKLRGIPLNAVYWGYLYNDAIFKEVGIKPAMTISEMSDNCNKLSLAGYTPFSLTYKQQNVPNLPTVLIMSQLIKTKLPDFSERMYQDKGSFTEAKKYLFNVIDLLHKFGTERPLEVGNDEGANKFANGEAAMWVNGPWMATSILNANPDTDFLTAPLPISDDPNDTLINIGVGGMLVVNDKATDMELALDFANFWLDDEYSSQLYQQMNQTPIATVHNYESFPWEKMAIEFVRQGKACIDYRRPADVVMEMGKMIQAYYLKRATQDELIQQVDRAWQEYNKRQREK